MCEINCVCVCTCVYVCTYVCIHVCVSYARTMIFVRVAISVFFFSSPFFAPFHEIFAIESKKQFRYDLPSAGQEIEEAGYSCKTDGIAMGSRMVGVFFLLTALTRFFFFFFFFSFFFFYFFLHFLLSTLPFSLTLSLSRSLALFVIVWAWKKQWPLNQRLQKGRE